MPGTTLRTTRYPPSLGDCVFPFELLKIDGSWERILAYYDTGNFLGDVIDGNRFIELGFSEDAVDTSVEVTFQTLGGPDAKTIGTTEALLREEGSSDATLYSLYVVESFPDLFDKYTIITGPGNATMRGASNELGAGARPGFIVGGIKDSRKRTSAEQEKVAMFLRDKKREIEARKKERQRQSNNATRSQRSEAIDNGPQHDVNA